MKGDDVPSTAQGGHLPAYESYDLFVSYAREHARFTPEPLRLFFNREGIRSMEDWAPRTPTLTLPLLPGKKGRGTPLAPCHS